ncbi:MAG: hypothetical protein K2V38_09620 [Gemmataceae bacterium]|nr:hypothetical protein [Gemmataceae bacterium]
MNPKITRKDVFLYHAGQLPRARRRAVEEAYATDPQVKGWYDELTPAEDGPITLPKLDLADPKMARFAAVAMEIAAREEAFEALMDWVLKPTSELPDAGLVAGRLLLRPYGMVYQNEVVPAIGFDPETFPIPEMTCPCIDPDYAHGYLTVRQPLDALADGRIEIVAVRLRDGSEPATFRTEWALERDDRCWHDNIPLTDLLPDGWVEKDRYVYAVRPANDTPPQEGGA